MHEIIRYFIYCKNITKWLLTVFDAYNFREIAWLLKMFDSFILLIFLELIFGNNALKRSILYCLSLAIKNTLRHFLRVLLPKMSSRNISSMKLSNIDKSHAIYPICKMFLLFLAQQLITIAQQLLHIAQQLILTAEQLICASVRLKPTQSSLARVEP